MTAAGVALRAATPVVVDPADVRRCLDRSAPADALFSRAFEGSLAELSPAERRGALAGVTGHVAESLVELILVEQVGFHPVWHLTGPGRHGVDLLMLTLAGNALVAIEVKGTLLSKCVPRLSRRDLRQMSAAWVDKADNPGMAEWALTSDDVHGAVAVVNFADRTLRIALTDDFASFRPAASLADLGAASSWPAHETARSRTAPPPS
jgi:hypothetical protein